VWLGGVTWWLHTTVLTVVLRVAECRILVWNSIRKQTPQLVAPKSDTPLQRPAASAFASSSVNLAPTKIRQASHPANHVQLECIKIRLRRISVKVVQTILTALLKLRVVTTPAVQQEHMLAEPGLAMFVELENTTNKLESLVARTARRENTMINKLERLLIAKIVELENTMTKRNARQRLIVKLVSLVKNQQVIREPVFSLVHMS